MRGGEGYCRYEGRRERIGGGEKRIGRGSKNNNNNTHPRLHFFDEGFPKVMMMMMVGRVEMARELNRAGR